MNLTKRIFTAIILLFVLTLSIIKGQLLFTLIVILMANTCFYEMVTIKQVNVSKLTTFLSHLFITGCCLSTTLPPFSQWWNSYYMISAVFLLIIFQLVELVREKIFLKYSSIKKNIFSLLQVCSAIPFAILIRNSENGFTLALFIVATCIISDICAYFCGKLIGKTPFSSISPKKTWEGTFGGAVCCIITGVILTNILNLPIIFYIITITLSFFCPIGDLYESFIKRSFNAKDSSKLLPGHGGAYDRLDSFMFALPLFYYTTHLFS